MTDEENTNLTQKAEEYAVVSCGSHPLQEDLREAAKQSWLDGFEAGRKEAWELIEDQRASMHTLENIVMQFFKDSDGCRLCQEKGVYLPSCAILKDEECLIKLKELYKTI